MCKFLGQDGLSITLCIVKFVWTACPLDDKAGRLASEQRPMQPSVASRSSDSVRRLVAVILNLLLILFVLVSASLLRSHSGAQRSKPLPQRFCGVVVPSGTERGISRVPLPVACLPSADVGRSRRTSTFEFTSLGQLLAMCLESGQLVFRSGANRWGCALHGIGRYE